MRTFVVMTHAEPVSFFVSNRADEHSRVFSATLYYQAVRIRLSDRTAGVKAVERATSEPQIVDSAACSAKQRNRTESTQRIFTSLPTRHLANIISSSPTDNI